MNLKRAERARLLALAEEAERSADAEAAKVAAVAAELEKWVGRVAGTKQALADVRKRSDTLFLGVCVCAGERSRGPGERKCVSVCFFSLQLPRANRLTNESNCVFQRKKNGTR